MSLGVIWIFLSFVTRKLLLSACPHDFLQQHVLWYDRIYKNIIELDLNVAIFCCQLC